MIFSAKGVLDCRQYISEHHILYCITYDSFTATLLLQGRKLDSLLDELSDGVEILLHI